MPGPRWGAPRSSADLLKLFHEYDPASGLPALLDRVDWTGVSPAQIYWSILGRWPEADHMAPPKDYSPRAAFQLGLQSAEFRRTIRSFIADALPSHRRWIFVHVPKCAGTDLEYHLRQRSIFLHTALESEVWTPHSDFFAKLQRITADAHHLDTVFISGHQPLAWVLRQRLHRFGDRLFTVIRDPAAVVLSNVNYIASRLLRDPTGTAVDTQDWLAALDRRTVAGLDPVDLAHIVLRHESLTRPNSICHHLGNGDAASALAALRSCDIEITDVSRYNSWLQQSWGINSVTRHNASEPVLTKDALGNADAEHVKRVTSEDQHLYEKVTAALDRSGGCSIRGWQVGV